MPTEQLLSTLPQLRSRENPEQVSATGVAMSVNDRSPWTDPAAILATLDLTQAMVRDAGCG
jgi:hypothetical protein